EGSFDDTEEATAAEQQPSAGTDNTEEGRWRGRGRRRRGRRGRTFPESKFAQREGQQSSDDEGPSEEPAAGNQRMMLPGESLAKFSQAPAEPASSMLPGESRAKFLQAPAEPTSQMLPGESLAKFSQPQRPQQEDREVQPRQQERGYERERRPERGLDRGRGRNRDQSYGPPAGYQP